MQFNWCKFTVDICKACKVVIPSNLYHPIVIIHYFLRSIPCAGSAPTYTHTQPLVVYLKVKAFTFLMDVLVVHCSRLYVSEYYMSVIWCVCVCEIGCFNLEQFNRWDVLCFHFGFCWRGEWLIFDGTSKRENDSLWVPWGPSKGLNRTFLFALNSLLIHV